MKSFLTVAFVAVVFAGIVYAEEISKDKFLGGYHMKEQGMACQDCHYEKAPKAGKLKKHPVEDLKICVSCHGLLAEVLKLKPELDPNPHASHEGEIPCNECHKSHAQSVSYCDQCHPYGFIVP